MVDWATWVGPAWARLREIATLAFLLRRDSRETAKARSQPEIDLWSFDLPEPLAPVEWRLAQLSRRRDAGAPRVFLRQVALVAPLGARLAPGHPDSPAAPFGLFDRQDATKGGAKVIFNAAMPEAVSMLDFVRPFAEADYDRVQFFVAMPTGEMAPLRLEIDVVAEEESGARREIRLRLKSRPLG